MTEALTREQMPLARPKLYFDTHLNQRVVGSRQLALATGHRHGNIIAACRKVMREQKELRGEFREWNDNPTAKKYRPRVVMTRTGMVAAFGRMRSTLNGVSMTAILNQYLLLFEAAEGPQAPQWAEPAPDTDIRPPPDTADMFKPADPQTESPPSWQINAALMLLRRTTLPKEIRAQNEGWNARRCAALHATMNAAGADFDQIRAIYATEDPDKG